MEEITREIIEIEFEKRESSIIGEFLERNKQIFELGALLAALFVLLTLIHIFLPKNRPKLIPIDTIEQSEATDQM